MAMDPEDIVAELEIRRMLYTYCLWIRLRKMASTTLPMC